LKRHEDRGMLVFFLPHSPSKTVFSDTFGEL